MQGTTIDWGNEQYTILLPFIPRRGERIEVKSVTLEVAKVRWSIGDNDACWVILECEEVHEAQERSSPEGQERADAGGGPDPKGGASGNSARLEILQVGQVRDHLGVASTKGLSHRCDASKQMAELRGDEGGIEARPERRGNGTALPGRGDANGDDGRKEGAASESSGAESSAAADSEGSDTYPAECPQCGAPSTKLRKIGMRMGGGQWRCMDCSMTWGE